MIPAMRQLTSKEGGSPCGRPPFCIFLSLIRLRYFNIPIRARSESITLSKREHKTQHPLYHTYYMLLTCALVAEGGTEGPSPPARDPLDRQQKVDAKLHEKIDIVKLGLS